MKIDFTKGFYIKISGEVGQYNSIPIDYLIEFAKQLQNLVTAIAKYDLPSEESIDLDNFRIELIDFKIGSAMPAFAYSKRAESRTGQNWEIQRAAVNEKFERLIEIADSGDYSNLKVVYPEPNKRSILVPYMYNFVNSFGTTPVSFADMDERLGEVVTTYKVSKFKESIKNTLIEPLTETLLVEEETGVCYGKVKYTTRGKKTTKKILTLYKGANTALEWAPSVIATEVHTFNLRFPLRCLLEQEGQCFTIQSELLDIIGTGETEDEAKNSFSEEFEFIYQRLNSLEDNFLTENNKMKKSILNYYILSVES